MFLISRDHEYCILFPTDINECASIWEWRFGVLRSEFKPSLLIFCVYTKYFNYFIIFSSNCDQLTIRASGCQLFREIFCVFLRIFQRISSWISVVMLNYSRDEILSLRFSAPKVDRRVRKTLFIHKLWLPSRHRVNTSAAGNRVPTVVDHNTCEIKPTPHDSKVCGQFISGALLNANSIRNKSAAILDILQEHNLDIFAFTETHHVDHDDIAIGRITPPGYKCMEAARPRKLTKNRNTDDRSYGGVAIVYRDSLCAKKISFDLKPTTFEIIAATFSSSKATSVVVVIYRPGCTAISGDLFYDELTTVLESLAVYNTHVVITGDFNIHMDVADDPHANKLNTLLETFGLVQSITGPTHTRGHTLDLLITRSEHPTPRISVDPPDQLSDHSLTRFQLPIIRPPIRHIDISTRAWKGFDSDKFRDDLRSSRLCQSPESYDGLSIDDLTEIYDTTLQTILDRHAPRRTIRKRLPAAYALV